MFFTSLLQTTTSAALPMQELNVCLKDHGTGPVPRCFQTKQCMCVCVLCSLLFCWGMSSQLLHISQKEGRKERAMCICQQ